jgi:hypothetical protein
MTVLVAYTLARVYTKFRLGFVTRTPLLYAIGAIAAYWSWLRIAALGG